VRQFIHKEDATEAAYIAVIAGDVLSDWSPELAADTYVTSLSLIKMGKREFALKLLMGLMTSNEKPELMAKVHYEVAVLLAESFNRDTEAVNYLHALINDYPNEPIVEEARNYLVILKSSISGNLDDIDDEENYPDLKMENSDEPDDALIIDENKQ